jgi:hypothetical protein
MTDSQTMLINTFQRINFSFSLSPVRFLWVILAQGMNQRDDNLVFSAVRNFREENSENSHGGKLWKRREKEEGKNLYNLFNGEIFLLRLFELREV